MKNIEYSAYEILGLDIYSNKKDIKRQYKRLIREFTPENSPNQFIAIRNAYEKLTRTDLNLQTFPIYKKPSEFFQQTAEQNSDISRKNRILSEVFEIPYPIRDELRQFIED